MPELPEVETIARALRLGGRGEMPILGRKVQQTSVFWPRSLAEPSIGEFQSRLPGQSIIDVGRRGKFILISLERDWMLVHLRMSGDLRVESSQNEDGSARLYQLHDRVEITFDDELRLVFNDTRKFGRIWLTQNLQSVVGRLGPEPFDPTLTPEVLYERLRGNRRQLKALLLDQKFMAGIGNIYADEALFRAELHPCRKADTLTFDKSALLLNAIRKVLEDGIERNGASIDWAYRGGAFQNHFNVYQRTGEPCYKCGSLIQRIVLGQRGTHFCPSCQA